MKNNVIDVSELSLVSAHDIEESLLYDFYKVMFSKRVRDLTKNWQWHNRTSFFNNKIPLVILCQARVIAHLGFFPFHVFLDGKYYTAFFGTDIAVLPEFQRKGIGVILSKKWMELGDIGIATGNKKSMALLRKLGWLETFSTYLHYFFIAPFYLEIIPHYVPYFFRNGLNFASRFFFKINFKRFADSSDNLQLEEMKLDSLQNFKLPLNIPQNLAVPVRDSDYISWRLLNSPDKDKYRVFTMEGVSMIVKLQDKTSCKSIDILWISDSSHHCLIRKMISTLAMWAIKNNYAYLRYYTSDVQLSNFLRKSLLSFVRYPKFMFYAKDGALLKKLKGTLWHWEMIDTDFEWI